MLHVNQLQNVCQSESAIAKEKIANLVHSIAGLFFANLTVEKLEPFDRNSCFVLFACYLCFVCCSIERLSECNAGIHIFLLCYGSRLQHTGEPKQNKPKNNIVAYNLW